MPRRPHVVLVVFLLLTSASLTARAQVWMPYVELHGAAESQREIGQGNLFLPLWQGDSQLIFADVRGHWSSLEAAEGNLGLAHRSFVDGNQILGLYGFLDVKRSSTGNKYYQATLGAELLGEDWGLRMNGYVPDSDPRLVPQLTGVFVDRVGNVSLRSGMEAAYWGMDLEREQLLWRSTDQTCECCSPCRHDAFDRELWIAAGLFHFDNGSLGFDHITGSRVRTELRLYDIPLLGDGSRLVASGQYSYDHVRGSVGSGMLTVRIPIGPRQSDYKLTGLDRRMVAPVIRDVDVISRVVRGPEERVKFSHSGRTVAGVTTIDGSVANPAPAIAAVDEDMIVVADGSVGTIFTASEINLKPGQVLLGGGTPLRVVGARTGTPAVFVAHGQPGVIDSGSMGTILAATDSAVIGLNLRSSGAVADVITIDGVDNVLLDQLVITTTGDGASGIHSRSGGGFTLQNSLIQTSGRFSNGITSFKSKPFFVRDTEIQVSGFRSSGIHALHDNVFSVVNSSISATGAQARGITVSAEVLGGLSPISTMLLDEVQVASAGIGLFLDSDPTFGPLTNSTINATVTGSTITSGTGSDTIHAVTYGTASVNLNARQNILDGGSGTIRLDRTNAGSEINVTQGAPGTGPDGLDLANGIAAAGVLVPGDVVEFNRLPPPVP